METPQTITIRIPRVVTRVLRASRQSWQNAGRRLLPSPGNVVFTFVIVGLLLWAQSAGALPLGRPPSAMGSSTNTIAYQGRLADSAGAPLTGTYSIIFRLYSAASGSTPLWEEQWTGPNGVSVSDGLFNVMLGSLAPIPQAVVTGNNTLWLGITVGTDDEMVPRVQLGSVPFAVQALTIPDASVTTAKIADQAVTQAKLGPDVNLVPPDGSITTAKLADGAVTTAKIANLASEPTRIATWSNDDVVVIDGVASGNYAIIDPGISVTVPQGQAYYYAVIYNGHLQYEYGDRVGASSGFYADYTAFPLANGVQVGTTAVTAKTGYRQDWAALGSNYYWSTPYSASWIIRLESGTHNLTVKFSGYSDNSMNKARLTRQRIQVMRLY